MFVIQSMFKLKVALHFLFVKLFCKDLFTLFLKGLFNIPIPDFEVLGGRIIRSI